ncbi:hypothetical protein amb1789 [Paramagnetospirillum magneticum AMB-1]|uniref:Uncharacterized protein n=1 Tax=Paramagnetospirillum magneticum (strain ATCC 700264 / AMB-1) TaxID=342108 RepID=Q2W6D2_PARM1|nr:hypothetical protein amb1789 [Paramagnetospirillum magneticum AMB-1]
MLGAWALSICTTPVGAAVMSVARVAECRSRRYRDPDDASFWSERGFWEYGWWSCPWSCEIALVPPAGQQTRRHRRHHHRRWGPDPCPCGARPDGWRGLAGAHRG